MRQLLYCLLVVLAAGCKERYESPVRVLVTGYLVVDGICNSAGSTVITLSRTTSFNNKNIVYEKGALVRLQGTDSSTYTLTEKVAGQYGIDNLTLSANIKYRLRINTKDNKQYISDFAAVGNNPAIDSISWKVENNNLQLYINTHDPQNNTRYYQWVYDEVWEIQSAYLSALKYKITNAPRGINYALAYRDSSNFSTDPTIVNCWQFNNPTSILLGSTAKLEKDIVYLPLALVLHGSIKLGVLYSLHVKQYSWSSDGYAFMSKMKSNTESTGSVFDPQPSELKGNIRCVTDAAEPVIGYFNICPIQEKRIFIKNSEVPSWGYSAGCYDLEIENISDSIIAKGAGLLPTVVGTILPNGQIGTFRAAPPECVDCTLRGTNKKPAYWP